MNTQLSEHEAHQKWAWLLDPDAKAPPVIGADKFLGGQTRHGYLRPPAPPGPPAPDLALTNLRYVPVGRGAGRKERIEIGGGTRVELANRAAVEAALAASAPRSVLGVPMDGHNIVVLAAGALLAVLIALKRMRERQAVVTPKRVASSLRIRLACGVARRPR